MRSTLMVPLMAFCGHVFCNALVAAHFLGWIYTSPVAALDFIVVTIWLLVIYETVQIPWEDTPSPLGNSLRRGEIWLGVLLVFHPLFALLATRISNRY